MNNTFTKATTNITSHTLKKLLLLAILLPLIMGAVEWIALEKLLYSSAVSLILFSVLTAIILVFFIGKIVMEFKKEEDTLRYQEKLSRLLVENRRDYAIFMVDVKGAIVTWNKGAERLMGYQEEEIIGKSFTTLLMPEETKNQTIQNILHYSAYPGQVEYEGWRVTKQGNRFWATITSTAIYDDNQQLIGFTKLYRNSTRQKEADEKLKRLVVNLEHSNQELERFAYVASHDLQEPLRMVASYTRLLEKKYHDKLDDEAREYIYFAVDGAKRMQQLIADLLIYSRVATRGKPFIRTDTQAVVEQAIHDLSLSIQEAGADIVVDKLPVVMADETQLIQLFQNLISNAIKFHNNRPPVIHISAKQVGEEWVFCVEDQGIGILPEYYEQIFLIFQRLHNRKTYPGTGVGLAISKKIVDRHGGRIWVESTVGAGSKFFFTLPIK